MKRIGVTGPGGEIRIGDIVIPIEPGTPVYGSGPPDPIDVIVALRRRGLGRHTADRKAAVDAVGPDVEKAAEWLRTHEAVPGPGRIRFRAKA